MNDHATYRVTRWNPATAWTGIAELPIDRYDTKSSPNRPAVSAKVAYDADAIHVIFSVRGERHVNATRTRDQEMVCRDSCVEFFLRPTLAEPGYFNFEFNCVGTRLCYFIEDASRPPGGIGGFARYVELTGSELDRVKVATSLTPTDLPAGPAPHDWTLTATIPLDLLRARATLPTDLVGHRAAAGFFKCADDSPEPHWASWTDLAGVLNFHQPQRFGSLVFA